MWCYSGYSKQFATDKRPGSSSMHIRFPASPILSAALADRAGRSGPKQFKSSPQDPIFRSSGTLALGALFTVHLTNGLTALTAGLAIYTMRAVLMTCKEIGVWIAAGGRIVVRRARTIKAARGRAAGRPAPPASVPRTLGRLPLLTTGCALLNHGRRTQTGECGLSYF